ncbi:oxygen-independent coproporphyrinogen III oxidase [Campylobacter blaseri]|uniref:Heme chaperone HemW n=1 Tax=Campylobacter blaseri TaxID=2042961 RepID=A0A2P8R218_9BACT|nr:radical SAM family heme chaperone HemW [Campylobacter blaseri]PSM52542.1 coproporphyrinogen III oxidase [Campylobacter blaseri]PSM54190.1 coproporphyrinogen III oxidase [Campylobacter blaseri]QKF85841.1 oxygen-independent coproporphyrinogen III oxidase [Campylobacter blaseri]
MHIYIHIPFCTKKCPYCAFGSYDKSFDMVSDYFKALCFEIKNYKFKEISTVFIGGGTPSSINSRYYEPIFEYLKPYIGKKTEITTEANPNSATFNWLNSMRKMRVNRVSFGTQSFDEKKLKFLGRNHSANDTKMAVFNAKKAGFKNINLDIIYGTKLDSKKMLEFELQNLLNLEINHISAYSLILEKNTSFENKPQFQKDSIVLAKFLFKRLNEMGFKQYEISNFGEICKHNLAYWKLENYVGFGAYAVGFNKNKRLYSPKDLIKYIKNPLQKEIENLDKNDLKIEHIFLGLRSILGVDSQILNENELKKAKILEKENKLSYKNGKFYNTNFLLADEIALFIYDDFTKN